MDWIWVENLDYYNVLISLWWHPFTAEDARSVLLKKQTDIYIAFINLAEAFINKRQVKAYILIWMY